MKRNCIAIVILLAGLLACEKKYEAPVPDTSWDLFESVNAVSLKGITRSKTEGVYSVMSDGDLTGNQAALKWSYVLSGDDTTYYLTFFCEKDITYIVCEGKKLDSMLLFKGYWRKMTGAETGIVRLTISPENGSHVLFNDSVANGNKNSVIEGSYGNDQEIPSKKIRLQYIRPLYKEKPLEILAHRGGGRNSDLLPASENSIELIRMASLFGATGVEIDVRLTSDGVPVLYHDRTLNERLIQKNGMVGPIENYSYAQLNSLVRLVNGEHIPTLHEALHTIVYSTPLRFVWLDIKFSSSLQLVRDLQKDFLRKAMAAGRTLQISIGIPDENVRTRFLSLPDYQTTPSVCELSVNDVQSTNAGVWAPNWTLGKQETEVLQMHMHGKKVFCWTLDLQENVTEFMQSNFDGILSNYPSLVAYEFYVRQ